MSTVHQRHRHHRYPTDEPGRIGVVILAAGRGERFGCGPKSALELAGESLLAHVVAAMAASEQVAEIVVTAPEQFVAETIDLLNAAHPRVPARVIVGGSTRQSSSRAGVAALSEDIDWVAITDVARPLVPHSTVDSLLSAVLEGPPSDSLRPVPQPCGAVPVVSIVDSVHLRSLEGHGLVAPVDRDQLRAAQTPQFFRRECIADAHEAAFHDGVECTDDVGVMTRAGGRVVTVPGDSANIKITFERDLDLAEALVARRQAAVR
jgi:2-C-methyl-D-erythritol 4-phosphate cytidylyltransferase